jgi:carnitine 3-dehydrogenase
MDHLMGPMAEQMWPSLGNPQLTPELKQKLVDGVLEEADRRSVDELAAQRDAMLIGLERVRAKYDDGSGRRMAAASRGA